MPFRKLELATQALQLGLIAFFLVPSQILFAQDDPVKRPSLEQKDAASSAITEANIRSHIKFLSDDLLEGRAPGSTGDLMAQKYIQTQLEGLGIKPAGPNGNWFQTVPLIGVKTTPPPTLKFTSLDASLVLKNSLDYVVTTGKPEPTAKIENAELVFVGYGIEAPEFEWNDYKDVDLTGKILVMMNNDPSTDEKLFGGNRRLYYGRWDYKYLMAARKGAAGAIIIHSTESAGYPYQVVQTSWSGEQFELANSSDPKMEMRGWVTESSARKISALSGNRLDELRRKAENRDFKPIPLGVRLSVDLTCEIRKKNTSNVLGIIPGTDAKLSREVVVYMAHHDHIGVAETRDRTGDNIYNGAVDNASGVASLLAIARAHASLKNGTRRSVMFASVGAEEQGLLGSKYFAQNPTIHPGNMSAVINMDGINIIGSTHDVNFIGYGKSSLDQVVNEVARFQNRIVTPDQFPDKGYYYRSDQFSLAKVGVPGIYLHSGIRVIGKPDGWGKEQREKWTETNYHQPSDEYSEDWDLSGGVADTRLLFYSGLKIADASDMPKWKAGDEFEAARLKAISER